MFRWGFGYSSQKPQARLVQVTHKCTCYTGWPTFQNHCCSVAQSCLTLCNPTDCSMPGFPVLHYLPEFAQTLSIESVISSIILNSSPSPPAFNLSQHRVFSNELVLHIRWPKYWSLSFSISHSKEYFRVDFLEDWLIWSPCCPRGSQESSPAP